jgi:para-nitrobenzyl esterase
MAAKGIVVVTVNYRLGVFGFMAHPELSSESPHKASGNYGLLDQNAALRWVRQNIASFGGDPKRVTIAGESAGSISVSAHMASPLSKDLIAAAIGESGGITGALPPVSLAKAEEEGSKFAASLGAQSIAALRAIPTQQILEPATKGGFASIGRFPITIDGYFLPTDPVTIYAAGKQARVPLLVGWNSEEMTWRFILGSDEPTTENYKKALTKLYAAQADEALKLYPAATSEEVIQATTDMAGDRFIAYSTWKWADLHLKTSGAPVYRYFYTRPRPAMRAESGSSGGQNVPAAPLARGAVHSAEIEYALGNLALNDVYSWTADDYKVSATMQGYFANFIRKADPNGSGLSEWPAIPGTSDGARVMRLDVQSRADVDNTRVTFFSISSVNNDSSCRIFMLNFH